MIKVLLYLSLLFASGIAAGEGVVLFDDNQLAQQYGFCEQGDNKKFDCDDQEDPVSFVSHEIVGNFQPLYLSELVLHSPNISPRYSFIRAPPTSY